jgi:hypothetical protein
MDGQIPRPDGRDIIIGFATFMIKNPLTIGEMVRAIRIGA